MRSTYTSLRISSIRWGVFTPHASNPFLPGRNHKNNSFKMFITQRKLRFLLPVAALFVIIRFLKERELIHSLVRVRDDNKAQVPQVQGGTAVDDGMKTVAAESSLTLTIPLLPLPLSTSTNSLPIPYGAISVGGCCGLGHRMTRLIPSILYGVTHNQVVLVNWTDVEWNVLFNNTAQVKQGVKIKGHHYS